MLLGQGSDYEERGNARLSGWILDKSVGLDAEAAWRSMKVQNEREIVVDWTLRHMETRRKSKRSEKKWRIGR